MKLFLIIIYIILNSTKSEKVDCYNEKLNQNGICLPLNTCKQAINLVMQKNLPQICSYEDGYPIVCCPEDKVISRTQISSISEEKCKEYSKNNQDEDFVAKDHIIGGENVTLGEIPHMVILGYGEYPNIQWLCGGSLISEKFILTAAHCVYNQFGEVKYVQLGDIKLHSFESQKYIVKNKFIHPEYNPPKTYNDIAILELNKDVTFTSVVKPICLYTNTEDITNRSLMVSGFGVTEEYGPQSMTLQKTFLEYFSYEECNMLYNPNNKKNNRKLPDGIRNDQICYGSRKYERDSCQGDSGGPLQFFDYGIHFYKLVGVVSFGMGCGKPGSAGVYTKVSSYVPWIENIVWGENL